MAACTDARISTGLPGHPKTLKLIRRLGPGGGWNLVCLFLWAAANRSNGDLGGMDGEDIELAAGWQGGPGEFGAALIDIGFLDGAEGSYTIHDWADHNPWAAGAEARSEKSRFAALCKQHGRRDAAILMPDYAARWPDTSERSAMGKADAVPNCASGMPVAGLGSAPSPLPPPSPSPSPLPNQQQKQSRKRAPSHTSLPDDFAISDRVRRWATEKGHDRLDEHLESFRAKAAAKGYTYADWDSAFMEAIRENWAKLPAANVVAIERRPGGGRRAL